MEDSGARGGAIYSRSGFTKAAILKSSRHGVGCFELWRNRPADVPTIKVRNYYACYDSMGLPVFHRGQSDFDPQTWDDLFDTVVTLDGTSDTLENHVDKAFCAGRELSLAEHRKQPNMVFPEGWHSELHLDELLSDSPTIRFAGVWRKFRSRPFATLLSGSFCVSTGEFAGTEQSPPISPAFPPSEKEWEEILGNIESQIGTPSIMLTKSSAGMAAALRELMRTKPMY